MTLTITVDDGLTIRHARANLQYAPDQDCPAVAQRYRTLARLSIGPGWMGEAKKTVGKATGCTHLTELLPVLATAALQTIRGYQLHRSKELASSDQEKSKMLNSSFGFRDGGRAQTVFWPGTDRDI